MQTANEAVNSATTDARNYLELLMDELSFVATDGDFDMNGAEGGSKQKHKEKDEERAGSDRMPEESGVPKCTMTNLAPRRKAVETKVYGQLIGTTITT